MRLPSDWDAERASGWWELHHIIHTPCKWRSTLAYDLITDAPTVRQLLAIHRCGED